MPHRQYKKRLIPVARELRREMTPAEQELWDHIRASRLGVRFRRQQPVGPYVVDFYCSIARVVVELDGDTHADTQEDDAERDAMLVGMGVRVLRFPNAEVFEDVDGVVAKIAEAVSGSSSW